MKQHAGIVGIALLMLTLPATAWALVDCSAPANCPTAQMVNARIDALAGASNPGLSFAATVKVSVEPKAEQPWKVFIETTLGEVKGERTFAAASCEAVTNAAVVFITLMLAEHSQPPLPVATPLLRRSGATVKIATPEPAADVTAKPEASQAAVRKQAALPVAVLPNKRLWHERRQVGFAQGEVAKTALKVGLTLGLSWERLRIFAIEVGIGAVLPPSTHPFANQPWIGITHLSVDTQAGPCLQRPGGRLLLRACSTVGVQMVRLISDGVTQPSSGRGYMPTVGTTFVAGWRLNERWLLVVNASVDVRLTQPSFAVQPWGTAWAPRRSMFDVAVGFEWRR